MTRILYCGNVGRGHDIETIFSAVEKLNHEMNLEVVFVGGGKGHQTFRNLALELELDNVSFCPPVPLFKLPELLASGDIHLVSQKMGTQGLLVPSKIYGILAVGRPVLFIGPHDCEVASLVTRSGAGIIVRPGDVDGVVCALRRMSQDTHIREAMGKCGRDYYVKYLGRERSVSRIIKAIESIT